MMSPAAAGGAGLPFCLMCRSKFTYLVESVSVCPLSCLALSWEEEDRVDDDHEQVQHSGSFEWRSSVGSFSEYYLLKVPKWWSMGDSAAAGRERVYFII